jgi:hypothetical protein
VCTPMYPQPPVTNIVFILQRNKKTLSCGECFDYDLNFFIL